MKTPRPANRKKGGLLAPLRRQKNYDYEIVLAVVSNTFEVDRELMTATGREGSTARRVMWYLWRTTCHMSERDIAAEAGVSQQVVGRGINAIRLRLMPSANDPELREQMRVCKRKLELRHRTF